MRSTARQADPHQYSAECDLTLQIQLRTQSKWNIPEEAEGDSEEDISLEEVEVEGVAEDVAVGVTREEPEVVEF